MRKRFSISITPLLYIKLFHHQVHQERVRQTKRKQSLLQVRGKDVINLFLKQLTPCQYHQESGMCSFREML